VVFFVLLRRDQFPVTGKKDAANGCLRNGYRVLGTITGRDIPLDSGARTLLQHQLLPLPTRTHPRRDSIPGNQLIE